MAAEHVTEWLREKKPGATVRYQGPDESGVHRWTLDFPGGRPFQLGIPEEVVDNPGMRELSLAEVEQGVGALFEDIETLAEGCRFRDCRHEAEPGCAVQQAVADGQLEPARFGQYRKLQNELEQAGQSLAAQRERRAADKTAQRAFGNVTAAKADGWQLVEDAEEADVGGGEAAPRCPNPAESRRSPSRT